MPKMVIFDLDGTLADSLTDLALSVNKGLAAAELPEHPVAAYRRFVGNGRTVLVQRAMGHAAGDTEKFNTVVRVFNEEYSRHFADNTTAYPGCAALLASLNERGILTAVLSNKPNEFVGQLLRRLYPGHVFAEAWGQQPQYKPKPDGEAVHAMLALHGLLPRDCLYVGDSNVDIYTAQNAGVPSAGVSWGFRGREELAEAGAPFVADTAGELLTYILSL